MWTDSGRLLCSLLVGAGVVLLWVAAILLGRSAVRALFLLLSLHRAGARSLGSLGQGRVALRGRVAPIDPVVSPWTGRRGIYLAFSEDRWERTSTIAGLTGQWIRTRAVEEAAPFELIDGPHALLVEPEGARFSTCDVRGGRLIQPGFVQLRFEERMIEEGDEVLVVGTTRQVGGFDPSSAYRGHTHRAVVSSGGHPGSLFIAPLPGLARSLTMHAAGRLMGALLAAALGWGLVAGF